jgi:uncharacterized protein YwqG
MTDDLPALDVPALLTLWVETTREWHASEHIGRQKRMATKCRRIMDALKERTDGTVRALEPLLRHADLRIRLSAAVHYREINHARYIAIARELAERRDQIGEEARSSLQMDQWIREHPPSPLAPEYAARAIATARKRALAPAPEGLSRAALEERVRKEFSADLAGKVIALVRPSIGIWPQQPSADAPPTASRFGGMPLVPRNWSWPRCEGEPLFFLAQLNCADLAHVPTAASLPRHGLLAFFGDHDWVNGCMPRFSPDAVVFHWPDVALLRLAETPIEDFTVFPVCALSFFESFDLPHPRSNAVVALGLDGEQERRYQDFHEVASAAAYGVRRNRFQIDISKLFGWPDLIQNELDGRAGHDDCRLLLQMGSYENGTQSHGWGPGGNLYFAIRDEDLRAQRFDRCAVDMQCT